jgi:hypothetical protein
MLERAKKLALDEGMNICLSNPCFELWFLLHYTYYTSPCCCNELLAKLKEYIPNYQKNLNVFDILDLMQKNALANAKKLTERPKDSGRIKSIRENSPMTSVYEIVEYINDICGRPH